MKFLATQILMLFIPFMLLSQNDGNSTTLEEYRYLHKGLSYQIEMGLDAKKEGYEIRSLYASNNQVEFVGLYLSANNQLKGITAILNPQSADPTFLGIPTPSTQTVVSEMYHDQKKAMNEIQQRQLDAAQREWQFYQLGVTATTEIVDLQEKSEPSNDEFTSKGITEEKIPEAYNIPAVEIKNAIPLAPQKMRPATVTMTGLISNRDIVTSPVIQDQVYGKARLAVKVCADANGKVHYARYTMKGSTSMDEDMKAIVVNSAKATRFANSDNREECGVMTFEF